MHAHQGINQGIDQSVGICAYQGINRRAGMCVRWGIDRLMGMCVHWWINKTLHKAYLQLVYYIFGVKVFVAYESVMSRGWCLVWESLRLVATGLQKKIESPFGAYILYPIEAHVDGLGLIILQGFVGKSIGCGIFHLYFCWRLWVPHFY